MAQSLEQRSCHPKADSLLVSERKTRDFSNDSPQNSLLERFEIEDLTLQLEPSVAFHESMRDKKNGENRTLVSIVFPSESVS